MPCFHQTPPPPYLLVTLGDLNIGTKANVASVGLPSSFSLNFSSLLFLNSTVL
jgi:hypothetical protein